jgi:hypothetical protein
MAKQKPGFLTIIQPIKKATAEVCSSQKTKQQYKDLVYAVICISLLKLTSALYHSQHLFRFA